MNFVVLHGNLTRDPEVRYTQDQKPIAKYGIAVKRFGKKDEADFFDCTAFGKSAEFAEKYLKKGTEILISGRLHHETWTDKSGQKRSNVSVIVDQHEFCGAKEKTEPKNVGSEFIEVPEGNEELPFDF